jgi:hypothetical protein
VIVGIQYLDRPERPPGLPTTRADEGPVYGTQLSVNASTTSDIWGTKNAVSTTGRSSRRGGGWHHRADDPRRLFDRYGNYQAAFYTAGVLAAVALVAKFLARRPAVAVGAAMKATA